MIADQREIKPFANIAGIGSIGNEAPAESLKERQHLFPNSVNEQDFRQVHDKF
jgi:hypothetical protein